LIENTDSSSARYPGFAIYNYTGALTGHAYCGQYAAGGTKAAPSIYGANGTLGAFIWAGHNGTSFAETARLSAITEATWDATHKDTRLVWHVASGTGGAIEKMRLGSNGYLHIGPAGAATEMLEVTGKIRANTAFNLNGTDGITTTFVDNDGNTITVTGGVITAKTAP
jgi:hypothetical protein